MGRGSVVTISCIALVASLFTSCHKQPSEYVKEAYLEQRSEKENFPPVLELNEPSMADVTLEMKEQSYREEWEKQPYENIADWVERINEVLELNAGAITEVREELDILEGQEKILVDNVQRLIRHNEKIREMTTGGGGRAIAAAMAAGSAQAAEPSAVPFTIHFVKKGETLAAIARKYYGSDSFAKEIFLWNQGWIRHPDRLMAGLGIVLFIKGYENKDQEVVENYLRELESSVEE